jgi:hypothetical protein
VRVGTSHASTRANCDSSPRAPTKVSSAHKHSIRRRIQGKALDFTDTQSNSNSVIVSAWEDVPKIANMETITQPNTQTRDDNVICAQTPDKATNKCLPIVYGSNVTMDSPDPFSKYHEGPGPIIANNQTPVKYVSSFDCAHTPTQPLANTYHTHNTSQNPTSLPIVYGSNVTMDSPDPFSKYHEGPGPVYAQTLHPDNPKQLVKSGFNYKDEIDLCIQENQHALLLPGNAAYNNSKKLAMQQQQTQQQQAHTSLGFSNYHHYETINHPNNVSPSGVDILACSPPNDGSSSSYIQTPEKSVVPAVGGSAFQQQQTHTVAQQSSSCRTGGFAHSNSDIASKVTNIDGSIDRISNKRNKLVANSSNNGSNNKGDELSRCNIAEIRKAVGSSLSTIVSNSDNNGVVGMNNSVRPRVRKALEPLDAIKGSSTTNSNSNVNNNVSSSVGSSTDGTVKGKNSGFMSIVDDKENARPSTGVVRSLDRQPPLLQQQQPVSLGKPNLVPTPPLMPRAPTTPNPNGGVSSNSPGSKTTTSTLLADGICGHAITVASSAAAGACADPADALTIAVPVPVSRPTSVTRRGRTYVESPTYNSISPPVTTNASAQGSSAVNGSAFPLDNVNSHITNDNSSNDSTNVRPGTRGGHSSYNRNSSLVIVGGSCILAKQPPATAPSVENSLRSNSNDEDDFCDLTITGRPITAKTNSPAKEMMHALSHDDDDIDGVVVNTVLFMDNNTDRTVTPAQQTARTHRPKTRITTVSSTTQPSTPATTKRKKSRSSKFPYRPLQQLSSIPEGAEVAHGVPSWLTVFAGYGVDPHVREMMDDVDALFANIDNNTTASTSSSGKNRKSPSKAARRLGRGSSSSSSSSSSLDLTMTITSMKPIHIQDNNKENVDSNGSSNNDDGENGSTSSSSTRYRDDTYGMWMSNQTIALPTPTINNRLSTPTGSACANIFDAIRANNFDLIKDKLEEDVQQTHMAWSLEQVDNVGNTPLIVAVFSGIGRIIRYLIKAGAKLNAQNRFGNTALHFSNELSFDKVTNYLIKKGADGSIVNKMNLRYDQRLDSKCLLDANDTRE